MPRRAGGSRTTPGLIENQWLKRILSVGRSSLPDPSIRVPSPSTTRARSGRLPNPCGIEQAKSAGVLERAPNQTHPSSATAGSCALPPRPSSSPERWPLRTAMHRRLAVRRVPSTAGRERRERVRAHAAPRPHLTPRLHTGKTAPRAAPPQAPNSLPSRGSRAFPFPGAGTRWKTRSSTANAT